MHPEFDFQIAPNWLLIGKKNDVTILKNDVVDIFFMFPSFSCQLWLLVQFSSQYHDWFLIYDNFHFQRIDQKPETAFTVSELLRENQQWGGER